MKKKDKITLLGFVLGLVALAIVPWVVQAGSLEPSAAPGPTTQIPPAWSQILPDADRFELVMAGAAVLDKETGLVWEQSPGTICPPVGTCANDFSPWVFAGSFCNQKETGGRMGWRLPAAEELLSLVDRTQSDPSLPSGHPFDLDCTDTGRGINCVRPTFYWSATTYAAVSSSARIVNFSGGSASNSDKLTTEHYIWCVRGGQGHDAY